jgi:hypothetical protein
MAYVHPSRQSNVPQTDTGVSRDAERGRHGSPAPPPWRRDEFNRRRRPSPVYDRGGDRDREQRDPRQTPERALDDSRGRRHPPVSDGWVRGGRNAGPEFFAACVPPDSDTVSTRLCMLIGGVPQASKGARVNDSGHMAPFPSAFPRPFTIAQKVLPVQATSIAPAV